MAPFFTEQCPSASQISLFHFFPFLFLFFFNLFRKPTASYHRHLSTFFQRRATRFPQKGVPCWSKRSWLALSGTDNPGSPVACTRVPFAQYHLDITWYTRNFVLSHASNPVISWPVNHLHRKCFTFKQTVCRLVFRRMKCYSIPFPRCIS